MYGASTWRGKLPLYMTGVIVGNGVKVGSGDGLGRLAGIVANAASVGGIGVNVAGTGSGVSIGVGEMIGNSAVGMIVGSGAMSQTWQPLSSRTIKLRSRII